MKNSKQLLALSLLLIALMVGGGVLFSKARLKNSGPALYHAAAYGQTADALSLIDNGAPVNFVNPEFGDTPLSAASAGGSDAIVTALLAHGANIKAASKYGETPLHGAASRGQVSTVKLLLSKGANPQARNKFGRTPLEDARGHLRLRRPSAREKVVYPQIVAILSAAMRDVK